MLRITRFKWQRITVLSDISALYKRCSKKVRSYPRVAKIGAFIVSAIACGLIIAGLNILPFSNKSNASKPTGINTQHKGETGPKQDNPLFASNPSWSQIFNSKVTSSLDPKYWNVLVGPAENDNNEQQYYTDSTSNLRIDDDGLHLIATNQTEPNGYKYGSVRLETQGKKSFLYGRIDVTAKLPSGSGTWPAVWLLPANEVYAKKSPDSDRTRYKNGGEIDILEAVGFQPDVIYGVAHTVSDVNAHPDGTGSFKAVNVPDSSTKFYTYTLLWTPTSVTFAINGTTYYTYARQNGADYKTWPFDQPFYMIANLALGGSWGGMDTAHYPGNGINNKALPASLDISSINYYPYIGPREVK
jgi:beta-glucanase (GH16 family)